MKTIIDFANKVKSLVDGRMSNIAIVEESPSTHAYTIGQQLIFNGLLYNATSAIAIGDTLEIGTNIALADNVVSQIDKIDKKLRHERIDFKQNIIDQLSNTTHYESADGLIQKSVYVFLPSGYTASNVECVCTQVQTSSCFGMTSAAVFNSSGRVYVWFNALLQNITAKALAENSSTECYIDFLILMK